MRIHLDAVRAGALDVSVCREALRKLAPRGQPSAIADVEIDRALKQVLIDECRRRSGFWPEPGFAYELAMILLMRSTDRIEQSVAEFFEQLNPVERVALIEFVQWCQETIPASYFDCHGRQYSERSQTVLSD